MRDLVSLLYRADWTRLRLAAEVTTSRDFDLERTRYDPGGSAPPPFLGTPRAVWEMAADQLDTRTDRSTLLIEPGRRYRVQGEDQLSGCDGDRSWSAVREKATAGRSRPTTDPSRRCRSCCGRRGCSPASPWRPATR